MLPDTTRPDPHAKNGNALASPLVAVLTRLREVQDEYAICRELVTLAIGQLHAQNDELTKLRQRHAELIDEFRRLRERVMQREEAA